jgi:hypothetical protein
VNLVNELQVSAERDDVMTVLRKAKRLASKLGVADIDDWLQCEQEGHSGGHPVPKYRVVKGHLVFKSNGPIPVGWGMLATGVMDYPGGVTVDRDIPDAMAEVLAMTAQANEKNHGLYMTLPDAQTNHYLHGTMNELIADRVTFLLRLNIGQILAIPEAVKNRVLDWSGLLERKGVLGENMTFNEAERKLAHTITFNISNSKIEQLNNQGNNIRG